MLITNGKITRNIGENQLHEYERKGYKVVEQPKKSGRKNKDEKKADEGAAQPSANVDEQDEGAGESGEA